MTRNHISAMTFALLAAFAGASGGCQAASTGASPEAVGKPTVKLAGTAQRSGREIGEPCLPEDGWQPATAGLASAQAVVPGFPIPLVGPAGQIAVGVATRPGSRVVPAPPKYDALAAGVEYCAPPAPMFPNGYWTRRCKLASDCPASSTCVGSCVKACTIDADCVMANAPGIARCVDNPVSSFGGKECAWQPQPG